MPTIHPRSDRRRRTAPQQDAPAPAELVLPDVPADLVRRHAELVRASREQERKMQAAIKRRWREVSSPRDRLRLLALPSLSGMTPAEREEWWAALEVAARALGPEDAGESATLLRVVVARDERAVRSALRVAIDGWGQALDLPGQAAATESERTTAPPAHVEEAPRPVGPAEAGPLSLTREGACWRLAFRGESAVLDDSKGMKHIRALLDMPGDDVDVWELDGAAALCGRPRRQVDDRKHARSRVGKAIGRAIDAIQRANCPMAANFLRVAIRTGRICSYRP